jgi:hypothetical protein
MNVAVRALTLCLPLCLFADSDQSEERAEIAHRQFRRVHHE